METRERRAAGGTGGGQSAGRESDHVGPQAVVGVHIFSWDFLVDPWLRLLAPVARGPGSIPGWEN